MTSKLCWVLYPGPKSHCFFLVHSLWTWISTYQWISNEKKKSNLYWDIETICPHNCSYRNLQYMFYTIWYPFYSLKNMRSTHGEVLLLVTATLLKITLLHGCFSGLLNCANGTKSRRVKYITDSNLKYSPYFSAGSHGNTCMKFPLVHFNTKQNYKERHLSKIVSWAIAKSVI